MSRGRGPLGVGLGLRIRVGGVWDRTTAGRPAFGAGGRGWRLGHALPGTAARPATVLVVARADPVGGWDAIAVVVVSPVACLVHCSELAALALFLIFLIGVSLRAANSDPTGEFLSTGRDRR